MALIAAVVFSGTACTPPPSPVAPPQAAPDNPTTRAQVTLPCATMPEEEHVRGLYLDPGPDGTPAIKVGLFRMVNRSGVGSLKFDLNALTKVAGMLEQSTTLRDFAMKVKNTAYGTSPDVSLAGTYRLVETLPGAIEYEDLVETNWQCDVQLDIKSFVSLGSDDAYEVMWMQRDYVRAPRPSPCASAPCPVGSGGADERRVLMDKAAMVKADMTTGQRGPISTCVDGKFTVSLSSGGFWSSHALSIARFQDALAIYQRQYHGAWCDRSCRYGLSNRVERARERADAALGKALSVNQAMVAALRSLHATYGKLWKRCNPTPGVHRAWHANPRVSNWRHPLDNILSIRVLTPSTNPLYPPPKYFNEWYANSRETIKNAFQIWRLIALEKHRAGKR